MDVTATNLPAQIAPAEYCFLLIDHWSTCMTKGEWSGWVQGVGTILAIMGSAALVYWQVNKQHELMLAAEARRASILERDTLYSFCELARAVQRIVVQVRGHATLEKLQDYLSKTLPRTAINCYLKAIAQADFEKMTSPKRIMAMISIQEQLPVLFEYIYGMDYMNRSKILGEVDGLVAAIDGAELAMERNRGFLEERCNALTATLADGHQILAPFDESS
jgi:hypothetical protein